MIDQLPEALILKILSSLPTKTVLSTSSSSKEWQSRWKSVPKFEFNSEDYESEHQTFPEVVSKSFFSSEAAVLDCFHLTCGSDQVDPVDVVHWIDTAFARQLRTLVLDFISDDDEYFVFTSRLCNCDTLETLKLGSMIIVDVSSPGSMKSLKTLHTYAWYQNDESILNLLSSCRILEELVVGRSAEHTVSFFTIEVPSLKRLVIYDDNSCTEFFGYTIVAPSLKYLKIEELRCPQFSLNAPDLVEANIAGVSSGINESLASVRRLFLDLSPSETPSGCIFYQLVYLQIYTHEPDWYDLLTWMLERSPKLQVLKLVDLSDFHDVFHVSVLRKVVREPELILQQPPSDLGRNLRAPCQPPNAFFSEKIAGSRGHYSTYDTEVTNRALGDLLRCLVGDNIKSWDSVLCQAEFAHNHATNRSTGFSPFHVVFGLVPRGPLDLSLAPDSWFWLHLLLFFFSLSLTFSFRNDDVAGLCDTAFTIDIDQCESVSEDCKQKVKILITVTLLVKRLS
ncbi:unnamed protein product [Brassica oleracea var. botrytis]|uniref:(rape) hypothetical protein n=1 Tax=Brassica napus TaxID=3708 RepID=A0A816RGD5_BRANA|nr:unnamed protein product [Brassica napus]